MELWPSLRCPIRDSCYVLACAHELPDRVDFAAVMCGLGPVTGPGATAGIAIEELGRAQHRQP